MLKKIIMLLAVAISVFSFNVEADAKVLGNYDLSRHTVTNYVPQATDIFTFAVVSPRNVTIHRGDLRQYVEADCLARDEFIVVSNNDMTAIRKALSRYYTVRSHGLYGFKGNTNVQRFAANHGLRNTLKVSFINK